LNNISDGRLQNNQIAGIIVGVILLAIILIVIIVIFLKKRQGSSLENLPVELKDLLSLKNNTWEDGDGFLYRMIQPKSSDYDFLQFLFYENMGGDKLVIEEAYVVNNPMLVSNYTNYRNILAKRFINDPGLFKKRHWEQGNKVDYCQWVEKGYFDKVTRYHWNQNEEVPIIPALHGTDGKIAWKICSSGFATLAVLDAGWYGSGIYFTSDARYALPYYGTKPRPTILVVFLTPGNPFPVSEGTSSPKSLCGKPIPAGYQSCYVHTNKRGGCCESVCAEYYDEIVIAQEIQVIPVFLLYIEAQSILQQFAMWQREIKEPSNLPQASQ